jgi:hypothetical protein
MILNTIGILALVRKANREMHLPFKRRLKQAAATEQWESHHSIEAAILQLCQEPTLQVSMQTTCCMCKLWRQIQCCIYKMCVFQGRTWKEKSKKKSKCIVHLCPRFNSKKHFDKLQYTHTHTHTHTHTPTDTTAHKEKKKEKLGNVRNLASKLIAVEIHQMVVGSLCMM